MNDLEITFIYIWIAFGLITDIIVIAPFIKQHNETETNKIPLSLIIIILIIAPFMYPLPPMIILIKL